MGLIASVSATKDHLVMALLAPETIKVLGRVDKSSALPKNSPRGSVQRIIGDSYLVSLLSPTGPRTGA